MEEFVTKKEFKEEMLNINKDIDALKDSRFNMTVDMALMGQKLTIIEDNTVSMNKKLDKLAETRHDDHLIKPLTKHEKRTEQVITLAIGLLAGFLLRQIFPFIP